MSTQANQRDTQIIEQLCSAYRAAVVNPPYDETDRRLQYVAGRPVYRWARSTTYVAAALLVVTLGLVLLAMVAPQGLSRTHEAAAIEDLTRYIAQPSVPLPNRVVPQQVASQSAQGAAAPPSAAPMPCPAAGPCASGAANAAVPPQPKISEFLSDPMKAAQEAFKAAGQATLAHDSRLAMEEYQVEIQQLEVAQAATGKSAFDQFVIDAWLGIAYTAEHDYADAAPHLEAAARSPYANPNNRRAFQTAAAAMRRRSNGK